MKTQSTRDTEEEEEDEAHHLGETKKKSEGGRRRRSRRRRRRIKKKKMGEKAAEEKKRKLNTLKVAYSSAPWKMVILLICCVFLKRDKPFSLPPLLIPTPTPPTTHLLIFTNKRTLIHSLTLSFASSSTRAVISSCRQPSLPNAVASMAAVKPPYTYTH